jgi:hypothetical protein
MRMARHRPSDVIGRRRRRQRGFAANAFDDATKQRLAPRGRQRDGVQAVLHQLGRVVFSIRRFRGIGMHFQTGLRRHAAPSSARKVIKLRRTCDLTVPNGSPVACEISACVRPRKNASASNCRCTGINLAKAACKAVFS